MSKQVIEKVRRSLGRTGQTPLSARPAIELARQGEKPDAELERFLDEIRQLSGSAERITRQDIVASLKSLVDSHTIRKATLWRTPRLGQLGIEAALRGLGVEIVPADADKHEMAGCDLGITEADYLLPETGTLVLRSSADKPRAVSLLPRIHLAIVSPEMLRPDLRQVFAEAKDSPYLVFITGPSRTADIELTVTLGVHGPRNLAVWMLEG
ncbi:MAG: lactate utilization protein [Thermoflexales bacterium]|nr:lactate utilization protein [Thermoflexales bacterium]